MSNELKISGTSKVEKSYEKQITFTRGEEDTTPPYIGKVMTALN
jgi:hypothetical protein